MTFYESILDDLRAVPPDTLIGVAIRQAIEADDEYVTMDLIAGLQSQAMDNPKAMQEVLGERVYKKLMAPCLR